jgi:hypothetical protein
MLPKFVNCAGLAFDIIGVLLLLKYGLPVELPSKGVKWANPFDQKDKAKYQLLGKIGLMSILLGFALQFVGNLL